MKRRFLSLVLLVAMLVTALPLTVLPTVAAEPQKPTYTEEDYNALYVKEGLIYAADFFRTNSYWAKTASGAIDDYAWFVKGTIKTDTTGVTVADGALTLDGLTDVLLKTSSTVADRGYNGATMEQVLAINTTKMTSGEGFIFNDLRFSVTASQTEGTLTFADIGLRTHSKEGRIVAGTGVMVNCQKPVTLTFVMDRPTDTLTYYPYNYDTEFTDVVKPTSEQMGDAATSTTYFYVTHSPATDDGIPLPLAEAVKVQYAFHKPEYVEVGGLRYIVGSTPRYTINEGVGGAFYHDPATDPGMIGLYVDGEKAFYGDKLAYPNNKMFSDPSYLLRSGRIDGQMYAVRLYDRAITEAESRVNHLADLAKFYGLDIGYYRNLDAAGRQKVADALNAYTLEEDEAGISALTAAFAEETRKAAVAQYTDVLPLDILTAVGEYGLDTDTLLRLPTGAMPNTYGLLQALENGASLPEGCDTVKDAVANALDADYEAYWKAGQTSLETYDTLYVKDGLFYAIDFFETNAYWGGEAIGNATPDDIGSFVTSGSVSHGKNGNPSFSIQDGYLALANTDGSNHLNLSFNSVMGLDEYDFTVEQVMQFGTKLGGNQFYNRLFWFNTSSSGSGETATISFVTIYHQFQRWGVGTDGTLQYASFWNRVHNFDVRPEYTVGTRAATLSYVWQIENYLESPTNNFSSPTGESAVILYAPELAEPVFDVSAVNSELFYSKDAYKNENGYDTVGDPGHYGFDVKSVKSTWTDRIGYNGFDGKVYALRYYDRALSQAETLKNHFADLAKFFRLNIEGYELLSSGEKAALHEAVRGFDMATSDRREVQEAVSAILTPKLNVALEERYAAYADSVSAKDLAVLKTYGLDPSPIANIPHGALGRTLLLLDELAVTPDYLHATERYAAALTADLAAEAALGANTAEEYNALYVQEGLQYSADFFSTNEYWGGKFNLPQSPATDTAYLHTDGKTYDFTKVENRVAYWFLQQKKSDGKWYDVTEDVTYGGVTYSHQYGSYTEAYDSRTNVKTALGADDIRVSVAWTEPFAAAVKKLSTAMTGSDKSKNLLLQYQNYSQGGYMQLYIPAAHADYSSNAGQYQIVPFAIENGYLRFNGWMQTENYLGIAGVAASTITDNVSQQLVTQPDNKLGSSGMMFWNTRIDLASTVNGLQVTGFNNFKATAFPTVKPTITLDGKAITLTHTLLDRTVATGETATANAGSVMMRVGTTTLYELSGTFTAAASNHHLFGYGAGSNSTRTKIYAIRMYTSELTNDEILQNHFADLAKFFRLNISGFSALTSAEKLEVYKAMRDLDLATSTREEVQTVYLNALRQLTLDRYAEADIPAEFLELTANYNLDLTDLLAVTDRDMSSLYTLMLEKDLRGKSFAEAAEIYAETYHDVYHYYAYAIDGNDAWNAYLDVLAEADLDAAALMALPEVLRLGAVGCATQEALDAYVRGVQVVDLAGMQVRIDSGLDAMPGVRAVFTINKGELEALVAKYGTVTFGAHIAVGGVNKATLTFTAESDNAGGYVLTGANGAKTRTIQGNNGEELFGFVYTVTYKNYQNEGYADKYTKEFSYRTFLTVGEETATLDVLHPRFGATVSAQEVYQHFYKNDASYEYDFANDAIVKTVLGIGE